MILVNGYIRFFVESCVIDELGNPAQGEDEQGDLIPCMYQLSEKKTAETAENSAFTQRSATITIESQDAYERLELFNENKESLGRWIVEAIEDLKFIDQTRLACKPY